MSNERHERDERRRQWWQHHHDDFQVNRSMKRRNAWHDYHSRCIYMVTMAVEGRKPVLGKLCDIFVSLLVREYSIVIVLTTCGSHQQ